MTKPPKKWKMAILIWIANDEDSSKIFQISNMLDPEKLKLINNGGLA